MRFNSWDWDRFDDEESGGQFSEGGDRAAEVEFLIGVPVIKPDVGREKS